MKAIFLTILIISVLFLSASCTIPNNNDESTNGNSGNSDSENEALLKIQDYFPIKNNIRTVYEGQGNEFASYDVTIDYTSETKVQQRINNGGSETVAVLEVKDGKLIKTLSKPETFYRENFLDTGDQAEILLMEPIQQGTTWSLTDSRVKTITNTSADVITPYGNYKSIEVTTTSTDNATDKQLDYYVKDVGFVKSVFKHGESQEEISSSLKEINENAILKQSISFYYPNIDTKKIYYQIREIDFQTNDISRKVLETAYKKDALWVVFSQNTKINNLYLNNDGMVYIDLSRNFLTEMNTGSDYESMMLQCITNTFGNYYGVQRVLLTIDNQLYSSGHIALKKGEYLNVMLNDTVLMD